MNLKGKTRVLKKNSKFALNERRILFFLIIQNLIIKIGKN
jgi:hypothetical protein